MRINKHFARNYERNFFLFGVWIYNYFFCKFAAAAAVVFHGNIRCIARSNCISVPLRHGATAGGAHIDNFKRLCSGVYAHKLVRCRRPKFQTIERKMRLRTIQKSLIILPLNNGTMR